MAEHRGVPGVLRGGVPAVVEMDHDLGLGRELGVLDAGGGGVQEARHVIVRGAGAEGVEQPAGYLVADGNDGYGEGV